MNISRLIRNNLIYYRRKHLRLMAGVAISGAVITGALLVGDSVDYSLKAIVGQRLGTVSHVLKSGDRYFTTSLAPGVEEELGLPVSALLLQEGTAIGDGGQLRVNRVQVLGVDPDFDRVTGQTDLFSALSGDTVFISRNLAASLNKQPGDELLLRIEKASLVPRNAPFVSDDGVQVSLRAHIRDVLDPDRLGRFNLRVSQVAPFNVFLSGERLSEIMDFEGRANVLLVGAENEGDGTPVSRNRADVRSAVEKAFSAADAGLEIRVLDGGRQLEVSSGRVFIDSQLEPVLADALGEGSGEGITTYFVNSLTHGDRSTPYSFVSTLAPGKTGYGSSEDYRGDLPAGDLPTGDMALWEVVINSWLAADLRAGEGDTVTMRYFEVGPLRELNEVEVALRISKVVELEGRFGDPGLMPHLPGLSDAGNCRDWETGVPIELGDIRDKDEDYWDVHGGTPKAFVSQAVGAQMWTNRFGTYTAFRYPGMDSARLAGALAGGLDPWMLGFTLEESMDKGLEAAAGGVDFSQLFAGLSFFLLLSGVLLIALLFMFNLESRSDQLLTLSAMGLPRKMLRRIFFSEGMVVAVAGVTGGILLALVYNKLVFIALNGIWADVVRTEMMHTRTAPLTLLTGALATLVITAVVTWFPLNRMLKLRASAHRVSGTGAIAPAGKGVPGMILPRSAVPRSAVPGGAVPGTAFSGNADTGDAISGGYQSFKGWFRRRRTARTVALLSLVLALALVIYQLATGAIQDAGLFFPAGGLLLLSFLAFYRTYLERSSHTGQDDPDRFGLRQLARRNALRNRTRSMSILVLFAIGAFLVVSTGSNRKDLSANAAEESSGTGGFLYYVRSTLPVLHNLDDPEVRYEYGLEGEYTFVQMRQASGDDASCLNLNKIVNPGILGVKPRALEGRFSFVTRTPHLDEDAPWSALDRKLPGGLIPAIADETVIKWGLGLEVGDTLYYTSSAGKDMKLLLIGGLAPSVFQGSVLISEAHFLEQYPGSSGTHVFLIDGALADTARIATETGRAFRDLGWDMQLSSVRLAEFNSVTNAYLSIFMALGGLGLLVGIFGLLVVLSRSLLERRKEIALLRAVGYSVAMIRRIIIREYLFLLLGGITAGFLSAVLATLPSLLSSHTGASWQNILLWLVFLLANGWFWISLSTRANLAGLDLKQGLVDE